MNGMGQVALDGALSACAARRDERVEAVSSSSMEEAHRLTPPQPGGVWTSQPGVSTSQPGGVSSESADGNSCEDVSRLEVGRLTLLLEQGYLVEQNANGESSPHGLARTGSQLASVGGTTSASLRATQCAPETSSPSQEDKTDTQCSHKRPRDDEGNVSATSSQAGFEETLASRCPTSERKRRRGK